MKGVHLQFDSRTTRTIKELAERLAGIPCRTDRAEVCQAQLRRYVWPLLLAAGLPTVPREVACCFVREVGRLLCSLRGQRLAQRLTETLEKYAGLGLDPDFDLKMVQRCCMTLARSRRLLMRRNPTPNRGRYSRRRQMLRDVVAAVCAGDSKQRGYIAFAHEDWRAIVRGEYALRRLSSKWSARGLDSVVLTQIHCGIIAASCAGSRGQDDRYC